MTGSTKEAERKSYLFRLRKKSFQDLELSKCETLQDVLRVTEDIAESQRLQRISECVSAFHHMQGNETYYDDIPIVDDSVGIVTEQDLKNAGHIDKHGNHSEVLKRELETTLFFNEDGFRITQESQLAKLEQIRENLLYQDETKEFSHTSGFDAYKEKIESGFWAGVYIEGMQLPGNGMYYESCGMFHLKGCLDESHKEIYHNDSHTVKRIFKRCNKLSCPKCWEYSIQKQALSTVDRLECTLSFKKNKLWPNNPKTRIYNHLVVSIPKSRYDDCKTHKGRLKIEQDISKKLQSVGIEGGTMIYHPFRFTKRLESVYYSPHVHVVGFGYTNKHDITRLYEKTGFIVKSINTFRDSQTAYNTIRYLLSHTGISTNKHRIKYFGDSANNKFSTKSILAKSISSIDDISSHVLSWNSLRKKKDDRISYIPLQNVSLSLVEYDDENDVKTLREIDSAYLSMKESTINDITKRVQDMALHLDNPAKAKSISEEHIPNQFLHVKLSYTIEKSKPLYRYQTIVISFDESKICPICTKKLCTVKPRDPNSTNILDLQPDEVNFVDDDLYEYVESFSDPRGQMYFDENGAMQYDNGVPILGEHHEMILPELKREFAKQIKYARVKATLRLQNGVTPTISEINNAMESERIISESVAWHKTAAHSEKITNWTD